MELLFDQEMSDESEQALVTIFAVCGFETECRRKLPHRGVTELSWLVLATLPLQAFLSGLGSEAVKDVYSGVKKLTRRKSERAPHEADGAVPLVLQDSTSGLRIVLEPDLPIEAYRQLIGLDLGAYRIGPLHYDRHRRTWRSELDETSG